MSHPATSMDVFGPALASRRPTLSGLRSSDGQEMVDAARGVRGDLHALARRHDRHRRPARYPEGAARHPGRGAVGGGRLRPDSRFPSAHRRGAGRPLRPATAVRDRPGDLHPGVAPVWAGPDTAHAHPVAERAGNRRGDHVRHVSRPSRPELPRQGAGGGVRDLGGHYRRRSGSRSGARGSHHDRHQLAGDLPRQRPRWHRGCGRDHVAGRGVQGSSRVAPGLGRIRSSYRRPGHIGLRADPGQRA